MKKIAIIGANEFQNPLILKAKELGYETYVYAWESGDIGEESADHFIPISIVEKEAIYQSCVDNGIEAVCSIGSDLATHTVNYIQRKLGNPCNPETTDIIATNKHDMRNAFVKAGVPCPRFIKIKGVPNQSDLQGMTYPMIVKPTDRSGSRGIFKVSNYEELCNAVPNSIEQSFEKAAIVEEYIDGDEYSCEGISFEGKHTILAFTKKFTTGVPHFIETGHVEPSGIPNEQQEKIGMQIKNALNALNICYGASHAEFKIDQFGNARIIEIGARMGGDCIGSDLVRLSTGYDFLKMVIDCAVGVEPCLVPCEAHKKAEIQFIYSNDDIKKMNAKLNESGVCLWRTSEKMDVGTEKVTDSSSRYGFYITYQD